MMEASQSTSSSVDEEDDADGISPMDDDANRVSRPAPSNEDEDCDDGNSSSSDGGVEEYV
jgi:hypothetical protein